MKKHIIILFLLLPVLVLAQDSSKKKAYYFYGEQCPHCQKIEQYFKDNGIYEKYDITKLECTTPFSINNAKLLNKFYDAYASDVPENLRGVPAVAFDGKFIHGDQFIIENFAKEMDAAENAYELPNPDNAAAKKARTDNGAQTSQASSGNNKYVFPVVLVALLVLGGGLYALISHKK